MPIAGVVADANVLLSAVAGKSALRVLTEFAIDVHVSQFHVDEVTKYLPKIASKYDLPVELVQLQWKLLPLQFHTERDYSSYFEEASMTLRQASWQRRL